MASTEMREATVVEGYTLYLSPDEASALVDVLANVGGDQELSRRKHTQEVLNALGDVGVKWRSAWAEDRDITGSVKFHNQPLHKGERAYTVIGGVF